MEQGQSIQKAIDRAPDGARIVIGPGTFKETLAIGKSITLAGAGWDKTIIDAGTPARTPSAAEKIKFADDLLAARDPSEQMRLVEQFLHRDVVPTITVTSAKDVTLRGLKIKGIAPTSVGRLSGDALVVFDDSKGSVIDCAVLGPYMNGIDVVNGSDVEIRHTLVAAMWGTGVAIGRGKAHLIEADVRNCYHRCITIGSGGSIIEKCRISGSAWHGIRYDGCSPTILDNAIFGSARSGIYASGRTAATVRGNVFWKNEMDGMSCWFNDSDTVEGNTFVENRREGIAVLGDSSPKLAGNVFVSSPVGIDCGQIRQGGTEAGNPRPVLKNNWFWKNDVNLKRLGEARPVGKDCTEADPKFVDAARQDFAMKDDSPARAANVGRGRRLRFRARGRFSPRRGPSFRIAIPGITGSGRGRGATSERRTDGGARGSVAAVHHQRDGENARGQERSAAGGARRGRAGEKS